MDESVDIPLVEKPYLLEIPLVPSGDKCYVFVDQDSSEKFEAFKGDDSKMIRDLQGQGKHLPIFWKHYRYFGINVGTIYEAKLPVGELFDTARHGSAICNIAKTPHKQYWAYTLNFKSINMSFYQHRYYPIIDFNWSGKRYRWVYYERTWMKRKVGFVYSLFILDDSQPSLADGAVDGTVSPTNPLLTSSIKSLFLGSKSKKFNMNTTRFNSTTKIGQLSHVRWQVRTLNLTTSVFKIGSDHPVEYLDDVNLDLKLFLIIATIFQFEEEGLYYQKPPKSYPGFKINNIQA